MVMEAAPSAAFVVTKPDLLLEFLIVALDAPAHLGKIDKPTEADVRRQGRKPVFGRFRFTFGPFDQQPPPPQLRRVQLVVPDANAPPRKARGQPIGRAFPPLHR